MLIRLKYFSSIVLFFFLPEIIKIQRQNVLAKKNSGRKKKKYKQIQVVKFHFRNRKCVASFNNSRTRIKQKFIMEVTIKSNKERDNVEREKTPRN